MAVAALFFVNGAVLGNWVTRIPAIQSHLGLGSGALGVALLGLPLGLLLAGPLSGVLMARVGSQPVTRAAGLAYPLSLPLTALAGDRWALFVALLVVGISAGALDIAINTQAAAVERRYGRPIMAAFHGLFSLGGLAGAVLGGAIAAADLSPLPHFLIAGVLLAVVALLASRHLLAETAREVGRGPAFAVPTRGLLVLGIIAFCALIGEGVIGDWSAIYLERTLGATAGLAAGGFAAFSLMMAIGRLTGDWLIRRLGPVRVVRLGGLLSAGGMGLALVTNHPPLGIAGFALAGAGFATIFPITVTAAAARPGHLSAGSAIAATATVGYSGILAGPPLIGFTAELTSLRTALGLIALLSLLMALLAPGAATKPGGPPDQPRE